MKAEVVDNKGKKIEEKIDLNEKIWGAPMNEDLVQQVVQVYLNNQRKGTAHAKTRGEVSGGGRKPWRQKGTGRARQGSIRSPVWVGGGVAFGPRAYKKTKSIPKKMNNLALAVVLSDKIGNSRVKFVKGLESGKGATKTKDVVELFEKLEVDNQKNVIVFASENKPAGFVLGCKNLDNVQIRDAMNLNVYDVISAENLVIASDSVKELESRLS